MMAQPAGPDLVAEAGRILAAARAARLTLGVLGGVGIALRCAAAGLPPLAREYGDIDLAVARGERARLEPLMAELGYQPDRETNLLFGRERLIYFDTRRGMHVAVMVDHLHMCHEVPFVFAKDGNLTAACLLLTKLQVVQTTDKDLRDIVAVLVDLPFGTEPHAIDLDWLSTLCARDWGLWRTATDVAERVAEFGATLGPLPGSFALAAQLETLTARLESAPKTLGWKARAAIGRRVQWYELPDEGTKRA